MSSYVKINNSYESDTNSSSNGVDAGSIEQSKPPEKDIISCSLSENSCNAVDNNISASSIEPIKCGLDELSFNGKITGVFQNSQENVNCVDNVVEIPAEVVDETSNQSKHDVSLRILQMNTSREEINERSPDMFLDDDDDTQDNVDLPANETDVQPLNTSATDEKDADMPYEKKEKLLAKKLRNQLASGVIPPPSVTYIEYDVATMLDMYNNNKDEYEFDPNQSFGSDHVYSAKESKMAADKDVMKLEYDEVITMKNMGLMYNRTEYTDSIEIMYMKLAQRYVGRETDSAFVQWVARPARMAVKKM